MKICLQLKAYYAPRAIIRKHFIRINSQDKVIFLQKKVFKQDLNIDISEVPHKKNFLFGIEFNEKNLSIYFIRNVILLGKNVTFLLELIFIKRAY